MAIAATHEKILIQGPIRFQHISALSFDMRSNQHGHMSVKGYFCPDSAQNDSVQELTGRDFCLFAPKDEESKKLHPIFFGTADTSCVGRIGDVYVANMNLISATSQLDIEPKSRSFQNVDMSYRQVVENVLSYTPNASADFDAIADQPIKKTLIQYEETDWAFIKRLASMLGVSLMADVTTPFPRFSFGQTGQSQAELSANEFSILMDQRFYSLGSSEAGQYKPDFLCYRVPSLQYYPLGSKVLYDNQSLVVCEVDGSLVDSELLYTYKVGHSGWLGQREIKNQKLIGLSLQGTVTETQREIVRIKLDIDKGRDAGFYPFSWIPESGNLMYCMPKKGTRATLYLPSTDTGEAVVITSPRTNGDDCGEMSDPQMRCFTTEHGKKMCLYPTQMIFSGGAPNETLQIQLDQLNYMLMGSTRPIQIVARLNIDIEAPTVTFSTPQEVQTGRSSVHAQAKVGLIIPKGTGGGNPPTGGGDTFLIMQFQFDALGEQGILLGLNPQTHDRFNDEPESQRNWGRLLLNFVIGAAITVAFIGLSMATGGIASLAFAGLAIGAAVATVQMTLSDAETENNRTVWEAIDFVLRGSVINTREALHSAWIDIKNGAKELADKFTDKCTEISLGIVAVTGAAGHALLNGAGFLADGLDSMCRGLQRLINGDGLLQFAGEADSGGFGGGAGRGGGFGGNRGGGFGGGGRRGGGFGGDRDGGFGGGGRRGGGFGGGAGRGGGFGGDRGGGFGGGRRDGSGGAPPSPKDLPPKTPPELEGSHQVFTSTPELEAHIKNRDMTVPRRRGIGGAHNSREFFKNDVKITSESQSKIPGVKTVEYRMPTLNKDGTPTGEYGTRVFRKTIYDPDIISDEVYIRRGLEAANDALKNADDGIMPREWWGIDSEGITWHGYFENGEITSFFPDE